MTNSIAVALVLLVAALLLLDAQVLHWNLPVVVGRAFVGFVEYASFWR